MSQNLYKRNYIRNPKIDQFDKVLLATFQFVSIILINGFRVVARKYNFSMT